MNAVALAGLRLALGASSALAAAVVLTAPALAQTTTSTVRGRVTTAEGAPVAGAEVTATNAGTGDVRRTTTEPDGSYVLPSLSPGTYRFQAVGPEGGRSPVNQAQLQVGLAATLDLALGAAPAAAEEGVSVTEDETIVVTAGTLYEARTSEIGTNVSQVQIETLPQNNRNFLNFAALAPGVRVFDNEFRKTFSGGGISSDQNGESLGSPQVNVFIDGVSLKSNVQQGGLVGQDASRGNPFSQLAIQEFRVITSNFKAEYEDAGTSVITAITKSGTNEFEGAGFFSFQNDALVANDAINEREGLPKPDYERYQFGAALGGPIVEDELFFFLNYEGNIQNRSRTVVPLGDADQQAEFEALSGLELDDYRGSFTSPFREHLGFAKLTWQLADNQFVEVSGSIRDESDLRNFGEANAFSRASDISNDLYTARVKHQFEGEAWINEASYDFLRSTVRFGTAPGAEFGRNYDGLINVGGRADVQDVLQQGHTLRNNFTYNGLDGHVIKAGVKLSFQEYGIAGSGPNANPQFFFRDDAEQGLDYSFPAEVNFGGGDPNISAKTTQIGVFVQDDWEVTPKLLLNLGLRWDYDSNSKNNDFVTPEPAVEALRALGEDPRIGDFFDVNDYISTGDRKAPLDQFQPRLGFSYDWNEDQRTVIFGGYGRYYDRALFRNAAEESLLTQYRSGNIQFSRDGLPRNGRETIEWDPSYLTREGFAALLQSLAEDPTAPGTTELRVIPNDLESPYTDQFSLGIRQRFGESLRTSLSYSYIIGKNQIGYAPLNRTAALNEEGNYDFIALPNGYSNIVAAFNTRETRYHAAYLTVDKPYSRDSGWGFGVSYTLAFSEERGFPFNFDFPNIEDRPFVPNAGDERHRLVVNGIVDLPWELQFSAIGTFSSGIPFNVTDASEGASPGSLRLPGYIGVLPDFSQVDLKLSKTIALFGTLETTLTAEVFNVFNHDNFGQADGFIGPEGNENFGRPTVIAGPPRSFQFGASFEF